MISRSEAIDRFRQLGVQRARAAPRRQGVEFLVQPVDLVVHLAVERVAEHSEPGPERRAEVAQLALKLQSARTLRSTYAVEPDARRPMRDDQVVPHGLH